MLLSDSGSLPRICLPATLIVIDTVACRQLPQQDVWGLLSICSCRCLAVSKICPSDCWLNNCESC